MRDWIGHGIFSLRSKFMATVHGRFQRNPMKFACKENLRVCVAIYRNLR
jgi:hypothetical protein